MPRSLSRAISFLGVTLAFATGPAAAGTRVPVSPDRRLPDVAPPWSEAGGFPPPRPLARTEVADLPAERKPRGRLGERVTDHPAVKHQRRAPNRSPDEAAPLFPRALRSNEAAERAAAMARHPSGKGVHCRNHVVRPGDSLWSIAEQVLGSNDPRAIARYWPRLHRANRAEIGPDPRLIYPGQVLRLPSCD